MNPPPTIDLTSARRRNATQAVVAELSAVAGYASNHTLKQVRAMVKKRIAVLVEELTTDQLADQPPGATS